MNKDLKKLIDQWEIHPLVASFGLAGTVQRITSNEFDKYSLRRYFKIGDKWVVSVDNSDVDADEIIEILAGLLGGPADHG